MSIPNIWENQSHVPNHQPVSDVPIQNQTSVARTPSKDTEIVMIPEMEFSQVMVVPR